MNRKQPECRPFSELIDSGLLWLINTSVLHPRGYALAIVLQGDKAIGWQLQGDGSEPWVMPDKVHNGRFNSINELLAPAAVEAIQQQLDSRGEWIINAKTRMTVCVKCGMPWPCQQRWRYSHRSSTIEPKD